jgi:alanine racemase
MQEGIALRDAGLSAPVLIMGATFPTAWEEGVAYGLTPMLYDPEQAAAIAEHLGSHQCPYPVHVKVETGMGRLGIAPEQVLPLLQTTLFEKRLKVEGLLTHLSDADREDSDFTRHQLECFRAVVSQVRAAGMNVPLVHAANSAAILRHPDSQFTAVRPGIMLYGYQTGPASQEARALKPVLGLSTKVAQVRTVGPGESVSYNRTFVAARSSRVAVLPVGYADGYSRAFSNRGTMLIQGRRVPVVGRVCMDMTMVDVTAVPAVQSGDEVVLMGSQGGECITADELASTLGTIPYEVLCAIGARVPRVYRPLGSES